MSDALVTVTEARTYLQTDAKGKPTEAWLSQVLDGLSARIVDSTGQLYVNPAEGDKASAREFLFNPADKTLTIGACREISAVEANVDPKEEVGWEEVEDEAWIAEPLGEAITNRLRFLTPDVLPAIGTGWSALGLHVNSLSERSPWPHQTRAELATRTAIRVTAKWGYGKDETTVPADVKLALLMWLKHLHTRDAAFLSKNAKVAARSGTMPDDVRELLEGAAPSESMVRAV